ncbi:ThrS1 protein [Candidatus Vecturithrix granuli]|uniref:ThrS1 protein n=1 Tax=Vecturithrix granuli TaxID=1499967 RepID=A0A0S6WAB0_VECG1|nr:ThrS1 protein [Candidatus Vecturithrix granuli]
MKLLMIYAERFAYTTALKALESVPDIQKTHALERALVGFIHVESQDEERLSEVETKLIKNLKWAARKNETTRIVLHSFAHLSESKAAPEATRIVLANAERRLFNADYEVHQTPFGYFLDLDIQAPGTPIARIFKEF